MKIQIIKLGFMLAVFSSCGSGSNTDPMPPVPGINEGNDGDVVVNGGEGDDVIYSMIRTWDKKEIKADKFPSLIFENKFIEPCKKGQIYFMDECFDEITYVLDQKLEIILKNTHKTINLSKPADLKAWMSQSLTQSGDGEYQQKKLVDCLQFIGQCDSSFYASITVEIKDEKIRDIRLNTYMSFGENHKKSAENPKPWYYNYNWNYNGYIIANGKKLKLPVSLEGLQTAYNKIFDGNELYLGWGFIGFDFEISHDYVNADYGLSPDLQKRKLRTIHFRLKDEGI